jgi:rhodanese-related sulfurtransferase
MSGRGASEALAIMASVALAWAPAGAVHGVGSVETISADDLQALRQAGQPVVTIDLRPVEAYRRGHLPGARSIPLHELWGRLAEVPAAGRVVLYADAPDEASAAFAALRLRGHRNMTVLEDGFAGWSRRGLPVEGGP